MWMLPHHPGLVRRGRAGLDAGYDYSGYVTGKPLPPQEPDSAYLQCNEVTGHLNSTAEPWRGIVTREGWKYVALPGEPWMLFNLKDDPMNR